MAKASNYTVVQQGAVTLKNPDTEDIDYRVRHVQRSGPEHFHRERRPSLPALHGRPDRRATTTSSS